MPDQFDRFMSKYFSRFFMFHCIRMAFIAVWQRTVSMAEHFACAINWNSKIVSFAIYLNLILAPNGLSNIVDRSTESIDRMRQTDVWCDDEIVNCLIIIFCLFDVRHFYCSPVRATTATTTYCWCEHSIRAFTLNYAITSTDMKWNLSESSRILISNESLSSLEIDSSKQCAPSCR